MNRSAERSPQRSGLCITCIREKDCTLSVKQKAPVMFCEEFEEQIEVEAKKILDKHNGRMGSIIAILEDIQAKYSYLPQEALKLVARETGRSMTDIYGVATFYKSFKLSPRGKHLISVCLGTACHVRGAPRVAEEFKKQLGISPGETTPDKTFTLETVNCLGACALGPVVVVDGHYFPAVNSRKVAEILHKTTVGLDKIEVETDERIFPVSVSCSRCNHSLMDPEYRIDGFPSIRVTQSSGQRHGWLRLSCLYGSYHVEQEFPAEIGSIRQFFCPHCHTELIGSTNCPVCGTLMVPMIVRGGGIVQICPRRGCKGHLLDLN